MSQFCGSCGFRFQTATGAFCAQCGAPRAQAPGAPQAPAAPQQPAAPQVAPQATQPVQPSRPAGAPAYGSAPQQPAPAQPAPTQPAPAQGGYPAPVPPQQFAGQPVPGQAFPGQQVAGQPAPEKKKRTGLVVGIGALVLAVGGAGAIGWTVFGKGGGAASPEAAVQNFFDAIVEEDVVGMLDQVLPGEVEGAAEAFEQQRDKLVKDGEMAKEGITDAITMSASKWELEVDKVEDSVALVTLADTDFEVEWDLTKVESKEIEDEVENSLSSSELKGSWPNDDTEIESYRDFKRVLKDETGMTPTLVTIEEDGRWYVSVFATVQNSAFEAAYEATGESRWSPEKLDWKTVSEGHDPIVGKDSREVVEQIFTAVEEQDLTQGLALLPQSQVRSLWASISILNDLMQDELPEPGSIDLEVKDWQASEKKIGDGLVEVRIKSATLGLKYTDPDPDGYYDDYLEEYVDNDDSFEGELDFRNGCASVSGSDADGDRESDDLGCLDDVNINREVFEGGEIVLIMREVDGGMQFDPLATLVHYGELVEPSSLNPSAWDL